MTVHYTATILTETLFSFLVLLAIFFWGRNRAVAAGVAFGFAALTRATVIPFLVCLPLLTILSPWRSSRRLYLLIFLTALSVPAMWTIRNAIVLRRFILVQSYGYGVNLFAGTVETKLYGDDGWSRVRQELISNSGDSRDDADQDHELLRRAIDRIVDDPAHFLKVRVKQYPRLFLDSGDYLLGSQNIVFTEALNKRQFPVVIVKLTFIFGNIIVLVLAIYGMLIERRRFVSLSHLMLFPLFLALVHVPLWIESRYSLPMIPLLLIFSARALDAHIPRRTF
jgi:4-amino-4-deoxy-L-arabinose transferase-like glycosyltransferase